MIRLMRTLLKLLLLWCLFLGACRLTGEWLDAAHRADICPTEVSASQAQPFGSQGLYASSGIAHAQAEPATHTGVTLCSSLRQQRTVEQGYIASLRLCAHLLSHHLTTLAHAQLTDWPPYSIHLQQPVCAYYIYALRRILI